MANVCSFDITSNVDLQEVDNALNQARKEVAQRYDFKGSKASIEFDTKESKLVLVADDEFKLNALWRSEEHTSELQSQSNLVCRLLLEKKKKKKKKKTTK